ncbi:MAG: 50S ribosomal protein L10 [Candidatus Uhrbacteria bacterium]
MSKTREQKVQETEQVADCFGRMAGAVLVDFTGVTVHELEDLRRKARAESCEYLVVKKTLFRRALAERGVAVEADIVPKGLSVLFGFADPIAPARLLKGFIAAHPALRILGGFLREGDAFRSIDAAGAVTLGNLPSRDELRARAVGSIAAPLRGLVGVLAGNLRKFVYVLNAIQQSKA